MTFSAGLSATTHSSPIQHMLGSVGQREAGAEFGQLLLFSLPPLLGTVQLFAFLAGPRRLWACGQRVSVVQAQRHVHSPLAERTGDAIAPDCHRRAISQRLMRPPEIVEGDPGGDPGPRLAAAGVTLEIDVLVLQAAP